MKVYNLELLTEEERERISTEVYDLEKSDMEFIDNLLTQKDRSDSEGEVTFVS